MLLFKHPKRRVIADQLKKICVCIELHVKLGFWIERGRRGSRCLFPTTGEYHTTSRWFKATGYRNKATGSHGFDGPGPGLEQVTSIVKL